MEWLEDAAKSANYSAKRLAEHSGNSTALSAAHSAEAVFSNALSTEGAIRAATRYAALPATVTAAFSAASKDSQKTLSELHKSRLWHDAAVPTDIEQNHRFFLDFLNLDLTKWGFWHDWYLAMWEGRFTDWDLAIEVAKIADEVWDKGAEAVAAEIEILRAEKLLNDLPQAEIVAFDNEALHFTARPILLEKPDLIGATLQQVGDSLEDVLASPSNGLSSTSREVRVIERSIKKYGNNPQQIEMGFVSAHAGLTRQIIVQELPASEENLALQSALEEGAIAIRATHPDVAENRAILTKRKFAEMSQEQKDVLADALPVLRAISDEPLTDDWENDIPALINTSVGPLPSGAPALPGADEATRIFSRAAKISILLRTSEVIHAIDQGAPYKAARILTTIGALVTIGLTLHSVF
ncbi:hypothetical protein [Sulfitobacter sp.]|uniref:hypothetical protein n=1 Tax=Sulfitobacter sp. TaxID=1903071 RepID=UPI003EF8EBCF